MERELAKLDLTFYSGEDSYSDGDETENYIFEAVCSGKSLDDIPENERTWPVFYHLTPIREGVCNWYPFKKDATILEIGSGCGAVTGVLCRNAKKVTSVELSKRRASINYERNKEYQNLEIIVGNLNDIKLEEKYDYITLIGVLEYAGRFTQGETPFHTFLMNLKKYLKPDGSLLIAIENRLGLKYFCGAPEDHTGRLFDGVNGYPEYNGVKTFSKSELSLLLDECGYSFKRFYYPYPDYKLPNEIFTDSSINRNKRPYYNYDIDRYSLFTESDISNVLQAEGVSASFANSFFVEARQDKECDNSILYAKLNQDRKESFRIGTILLDKDGEIQVEKKAFHPNAVGHIEQLEKNDQKEYGDINVNKGELRDDAIIYPFIKYKSLDVILKNLILFGRVEEFKEQIDLFISRVFSDSFIGKPNTAFFRQVFGNESLPEVEMKCVCPANIDITAANVFCTENSYIITDCEWVFDFPIPTDFIIWRMVRSLYVSVPEIARFLTESSLLEYLGVKNEDITVFSGWESSFVDNFVCSKGNGIPKKNQFKEIVYGKEEKLEEERSCLEIEKANLEREKTGLEREKASLEREKASLEREKASLEREKASLEREKESLEREKESLEREKESLEREKIVLNHRIESAHQLMQHFAHLKTFKFLNLNNRINLQYRHGSDEDRKEFRKWLKNLILGRKNTDHRYNCMVQMENALYGSEEVLFEQSEGCKNIDFRSAGRIDIITPGHTLFIAKQLQVVLIELNIECAIHFQEYNNYEDIPYIVICPQVMPQLPPCYICFQMEQTINSRWLTDKYIRILEQSVAVLDYSKINIEYFSKYDNLKDKMFYVPIGADYVENIEDGYFKDQKYDVLFYGDVNCNRRKRILDELGKNFNIHIEHDLFGEKMLDVIKQSKVVLNIHYYEDALLETTRIAEILSLGTSVIVSERSNDPDEENRIDSIVDFVDIDDIAMMKERIAYWLNNPEVRVEKIRAGKQIINTSSENTKKYFVQFLSERGVVAKEKK